jgi:hypothetical protein
MMDGPWQVEPWERPLEDGEEAEFRVCDARVKMIPEMKHHNTNWLTNWHWDPRDDIDPPKSNKYRLNMPIAAYTTTCEESVYSRPAGKQSCGASVYDQVPDEMRQNALMTLRCTSVTDEVRSMTPFPMSAR